MPKFNSFKTFAVVMMAASLGACQDYSPISLDEMRFDARNKEFTDDFINRFGTPDPNQNWGMNETLQPILALSAGEKPRVTRAAGFDDSEVSRVLTNRNEWVKIKDWDPANKKDSLFNGKTIQVPIYDKDALAHDINIPGWPHLNGLYYGSTGAGAYDYNNALTGQELTTNMQPIGDVTPFEIQYVSTWFRTHRITQPEKFRENLHLSDFFIQNVSCDDDQIEYRNYVTDSWANVTSGGEYCFNNGENIKSSSDESRITDNNLKGNIVREQGRNESVQYFLDDLGFKDADGKWTHVNNFNRQNSNYDPENKNDNPNREIKYVKSAGTEDFHCHPSWNTNSLTNYIDSWVLVRLTWNETVIHANSPFKDEVIPREGYYLAFDFKAGKDGVTVNGDGFYSNWIVKITPGNFNPMGNSRRIFCEDLGGSAKSDFDFNDAVVDVAFDKLDNGKYQPIITVQATGATIPIWVEKEGSFYELHNLLGNTNGAYKQINVDDTEFPNKATVATYRGGEYDAANVSDIHIIVDNSSYPGGGKYDLTGGAYQRVNFDDNNNPYKGGTIAPRAFATPVDVRWSKEYESIDDSYPKFAEWVKDKNWETDTPVANTRWFNIKGAKGTIYEASMSMNDGSPTAGNSTTPSSWIDLNFPETFDESKTLTMYSNTKADAALMLKEYVGTDAINQQLNNLSDNHQITFTVVFSSPTAYDQKVGGDSKNLEAIAVPADVDAQGNMSYKGTNFTTGNLSKFQMAALHDSNHEFCTMTNNECTSHQHVYTATFSFTKAQLMNSALDDYCGWLLFYLKVPDADPNVGKGKGTNGMTLRHMYIHY